MKVELLHLGAANKPSPISEGVTEIRINSQSMQGYKSDNMTHAGPVGTMSGNSSRRGQRVGPGPTMP
jgi:hypothetical protein